jgi:Domain of unknown function (DUF5916)
MWTFQQFNLTPYKLFFPEKRQFFLENAGVFAFPMSLATGSDQLFFSRQIGIDPITGQEVPINGGAKVTGSLAGFELGMMDVDTRSSGPNPWANYAVLRLKRSLWGTGSYLGVMGIDKRSGNVTSPFNQTAGVDGRFVLFRNLVLNGYAAQTRTPGYSSGQSNLGAGLNFRSNWLDFQAEHRRIGPNLQPPGRISRTQRLPLRLRGCHLQNPPFILGSPGTSVRRFHFSRSGHTPCRPDAGMADHLPGRFSQRLLHR